MLQRRRRACIRFFCVGDGQENEPTGLENKERIDIYTPSCTVACFADAMRIACDAVSFSDFTAKPTAYSITTADKMTQLIFEYAVRARGLFLLKPLMFYGRVLFSGVLLFVFGLAPLLPGFAGGTSVRPGLFQRILDDGERSPAGAVPMA